MQCFMATPHNALSVRKRFYYVNYDLTQSADTTEENHKSCSSYNIFLTYSHMAGNIFKTNT